MLNGHKTKANLNSLRAKRRLYFDIRTLSMLFLTMSLGNCNDR